MKSALCKYLWCAVRANMAGFAEYQLFKLQIDELTLMEKGNLNLVVSFRNIKNYKALASQKKKGELQGS